MSGNEFDVEQVGFENESQNENQNFLVPQTPSIKLTKNAKGNYQYEVKILSLDIKELKKITDELDRVYKND